MIDEWLTQCIYIVNKNMSFPILNFYCSRLGILDKYLFVYKSSYLVLTKFTKINVIIIVEAWILKK